MARRGPTGAAECGTSGGVCQLGRNDTTTAAAGKQHVLALLDSQFLKKNSAVRNVYLPDFLPAYKNEGAGDTAGRREGGS